MRLILALLLSQWASALEIRQLPVDFTTRNVQLKEGMMAYGYKLSPWSEWIHRATAGPLQIPTKFNKSDLEVFEARSAGIVRRPIGFFTPAYLHNIETLRKLSPQNKHTIVPGAKFSVETVIPFPVVWAEIIAIAKSTGILDDKTTDHIRLTSVFDLKTKKEIESSPALRQAIESLDIVGQTPNLVNLQGTIKVNQIADFISVVTLFYEVGPKQTLVVNHMAIALKRHLLQKGVEAKGLRLNGRSILMGENAVINTDKGIGAGLPKFGAEFFAGMLEGLEK